MTPKLNFVEAFEDVVPVMPPIEPWIATVEPLLNIGAADANSKAVEEGSRVNRTMA